jgi:hypothetical protein
LDRIDRASEKIDLKQMTVNYSQRYGAIIRERKIVGD